MIEPRNNELSLVYIGLALKRFSRNWSSYLFRRIGIDIAAATDLVKDLDSTNMRSRAMGDVQKGLLE